MWIAVIVDDTIDVAELGTELRDVFTKALSDGVKGVLLYLVGEYSLSRVLPAIRDVLLNNIALGVVMYMLDHNTALNVVKEAIDRSAHDPIKEFIVIASSSNALVHRIVDVIKSSLPNAKIVVKVKT